VDHDGRRRSPRGDAVPPDGDEPTPCFLEALPYRKDDVTASYIGEYERLRDEYGYAVCGLDLRGPARWGAVDRLLCPAVRRAIAGRGRRRRQWRAERTDRYAGTVAVNRRTWNQSASSSASSSASFAIRWPEAAVRTASTVEFATTDETFEVTITLEAAEVRPEGGKTVVGKHEWTRTISRNLA
jgi:hypothetical protein